MIEINGIRIGEDESVFIIAEAGVNHNGDLELAKRLVDAAVDAGVDAVKFQTFKTDDLVTENAPKAEYQQKFTGREESQYEMLRKLELTKEEHNILKKYCAKQDIIFMSTPFDFESVDLLEEIGVAAYKVGSGDLTNLPLLEYIAKKDKPIILSTGMSNLGEVEEAVNIILDNGNEKLVLLHCVSNYPTEYCNVNLRAIDTMREVFKIPIGYSDHTLGIEVPIAAVARGSKVIEKHFTLNKKMEGPDHQASLKPDQLRTMVENIRNIEQSLGNGIKAAANSEQENKKVVRKSLTIDKSVKSGAVVTDEIIKIRRPGIGIAPKLLKRIIGLEVKKDLKVGHVLKWNDLKDE